MTKIYVHHKNGALNKISDDKCPIIDESLSDPSALYVSMCGGGRLIIHRNDVKSR